MSELLVIILGFCGGVVGGLLGVGGGIIFVPALVIFLGDSQLEAESTSLLAIVPVAIAGVIRQRGYGNVRVRDGITIGLLSIPGVAIGVLVSNAVPQRALEIGFAGLLLVVAAQLVLRAFRKARDDAAEPGAADA
ncbi:MAG TPA: sulfite exporter TauE/SafE family protein [Solirubrobacterales bacterium]